MRRPGLRQLPAPPQNDSTSSPRCMQSKPGSTRRKSESSPSKDFCPASAAGDECDPDHWKKEVGRGPFGGPPPEACRKSDIPGRIAARESSPRYVTSEPRPAKTPPEKSPGPSSPYHPETT